MAVPTTLTATATLATGVGIAALMPGINGDALIGAFAGGTLFVVSARNFARWERCAYLAVSVPLGYLGAPEVQHFFPGRSIGLAAFVAGACGVTITLAIIRACQHVDFTALLDTFVRGKRRD
ncbi:putative holin [Lysobacter arvi]|uniref:Holin n=1 Tax=Lysobacter arvi TaxID=3038776 RepID=A0ABU1CB26_9GAMM|nr:putative holin [Lysobacter arvi]MDR0182401.1 putative holin [Lysobacter arvi]